MIQNLIISNKSGLPSFGRFLMWYIGVNCVDLAKDSSLDDDSILKSALFSAKLIYDGAESHEFHELEMGKTVVLSYQSS